MLVIGNPGLQPTEISEQLHLTPSTITRLVEKLEEKGLVARTSSGKITHVYPSPKGKAMLNRMKDCVSVFDKKCGSILGKEESSALVHRMGRMADKLEA
jgi:DNA-binding MarR family transcriptional regulator